MRQKQSGLTYLAVLFAVAISAIVLMGESLFTSIERRRSQEEALLFVGDQFRHAIASYYESSPGPVKHYPSSLDDLVRDSRFLATRRHLRRIYSDPLTEKKTWGQVLAPDGGIMGVYSLENAKPLKQTHFSEQDYEFERQSSYENWIFIYRGEQTRFIPPIMLLQLGVR